MLPAALALILGSVAAIAERHYVLYPDAVEFQALARQMSLHTVFGGVREPLWPVLLVLPVRLFGDHSALAIRFIGVLGFIFLVIAFQLLARQLFGRSWSIAGALLIALTPWLVYQAALGLREETSAALILLLCLGLIQPKISGPRFVLLFALAGITGLLRWDAMVIMLPVLGLALLIRRPHAAAWFAGPAVVALLVGPLLLANYVQHGDPLYSTNIHARYYRNVEFHDQPGFVTSAQMAANSFAGPRITWTQYVFGLHSTGELTKRALSAFVIIPVNVTTDTVFLTQHDRLLPALVISLRNAFGLTVAPVILILAVGGAASLLRSRAWMVPVILAEIILVYSPIASFVDYRLVLPVYPLMVLCVIETIRILWRVPALRAAGLRPRSGTGAR